MYALVYQPAFPHWLFLIYHQNLTATRHQKLGQHIALYADEKLIGVNIWVEHSFRSTLQPGIQRTPSKEVLDYVASALSSLVLPHPVVPFCSGFLKARIRAKEEHPDSDHLFVCQVSFGSVQKQIVTNSTTVQVGDGVVVAIAGTLLRDGSMMEVTSMLKQTTEGMLCSQKTLEVDPVTKEGVLTFSWTDEDLGKDYFYHA